MRLTKLHLLLGNASGRQFNRCVSIRPDLLLFLHENKTRPTLHIALEPSNLWSRSTRVRSPGEVDGTGASRPPSEQGKARCPVVPGWSTFQYRSSRTHVGSGR